MEEIVFAHFLVFLPVVIVQIIGILFVPNEVLETYKNINYWTAIVIMFYLAVEGMVLGK